MAAGAAPTCNVFAPAVMRPALEMPSTLMVYCDTGGRWERGKRGRAQGGKPMLAALHKRTAARHPPQPQLWLTLVPDLRPRRVAPGVRLSCAGLLAPPTALA